MTSQAAIALGQFFQITVSSATGIQDLAGNLSDGDADGRPDGNYSTIVGPGTTHSYPDRNGDMVTLTLRGGGVIKLTRGSDGEGLDLRLLQTVPGRGVLSGTVKRPRGSLTADGITTLRSISGASGVRNRLSNPPFVVGAISADVVDLLLAGGELSGLSRPERLMD